VQPLQQCRLADTGLTVDQQRPRDGELVGKEAVENLDLLGPADDRLHAAALLPGAPVHSMTPIGTVINRPP
jgi:hypothetical protein